MTKHFHLYLSAIIFFILWTLLFSFETHRDISIEKQKTVELARKEAFTTFNKDLSIRLWATEHGGVYVPISVKTPPNKYLSHIPERDITTPSGKKLTLMNPAYMLRQVMADYEKLYGTKGYITSLKALNPINKPDDWQGKALKILENGKEKEVLEITQSSGERYLRLMRPLFTKEGCLKCHGHQGYKVGDVRGGIEVQVAMSEYLLLEKQAIKDIIISHFFFWLLGVLALISFFVWGNNTITKENLINEQLLLTNKKLLNSLDEIKTLRGIIPICAYCKKIRDEEGSWEKLEAYIHSRSEAEFSHGICPECLDKQMKEND